MTAIATRRSVLRGFGLAAVGAVAGLAVARRTDAPKPTPVTAPPNA
jgi:hypothetical protein